MAFTGTPVVKQISDRLVRITGLSLTTGAAGTIGLHGATGSTPGVELPATFKTAHYAFLGANVPFQDAIEVTAAPAATGVATAVPIAIVKSGTTIGDFRATITNTHATLATPNMEIMVRFHE
jgi:hypothetical protein